jgi:hypothetical protein
VPAQGLPPQVGASSAIAVHRRPRRATRDGVDVRPVLRLLRRLHHGARDGWRVGQVPTVEAEEQRPRHREVATLQQERASTPPRIQGWRRSQGRRLTRRSPWPEPLEA